MMMGMRATGVALVCVVSAATADEMFPAPTWWKDTVYQAPLSKDQVPDVSKFPGATLAATDAAFPLGKQPPNMAAWEKDAEGNPKPCAHKVTGAEDTDKGWNGNCLDLRHFPEIKTEAECKKTCEEHALCPSWQHNPETGCWMGGGLSCSRDRPALTGESAERLQHGSVTVLADLKAAGFQIMGLTKVGKFLREDGTQPSTEAGIKDCKDFCYSDIRCQYWQFSSEDGCWYDYGGNAALNELTTENTQSGSDAQWIGGFEAGEYIQHYCPLPEAPAPTPAPVVAPAPKPAPDLTWLWITLGVLGALLIAATVYFLRPKPKKVRAVKPLPAPAPEVEPLVEKLPTRYSTRTEMLPPIFVR